MIVCVYYIFRIFHLRAPWDYSFSKSTTPGKWRMMRDWNICHSTATSLCTLHWHPHSGGALLDRSMAMDSLEGSHAPVSASGGAIVQAMVSPTSFTITMCRLYRLYARLCLLFWRGRELTSPPGNMILLLLELNQIDIRIQELCRQALMTVCWL